MISALRRAAVAAAAGRQLQSSTGRQAWLAAASTLERAGHVASQGEESRREHARSSSSSSSSGVGARAGSSALFAVSPGLASYGQLRGFHTSAAPQSTLLIGGLGIAAAALGARYAIQAYERRQRAEEGGVEGKADGDSDAAGAADAAGASTGTTSTAAGGEQAAGASGTADKASSGQSGV
jgi:hypothetical protein